MENYVGKRIDGRYEIREIIGVGGMAVVYKAYDNIDDRIVAVKILKEEFLANEEFRRRFKNESKAIAVLSHPNIVNVYDVSFGDRLQYIVMEFVEGITLKEYIEQQGVINCREVVHFTSQILRALQHAHDKGIVHRDIKPQNILLLQNGTIKVTDFGIARFSRSDTRTMTENAIGSVHYISPEQARGDITDEKADIYSVGVLMYEMLTGKLPFQNDNPVSVALMQVQEDAAPPTSINSDIPTGLEQITMRAMQKSTRDRYQSSAEMLLDLEEYKRNPSVVFNYSYFVDSEPTKFIRDDISNRTDFIDSAEQNKFDDISSNYDENTQSKSTKKTVIIAVLASLLAVLFFVAGGLILFGGKKIAVPAFTNIHYEDEIKNNDKYKDFVFTIIESKTTSYEDGVVISQDPAKGSSVRKGSSIKLTVAQNIDDLTVPDVYGMSLEAAKKALENVGLFVKEELEYSADTEEGYVIRTSPKKSEPIEPGDTVIIYVCDPTASAAITVPDIYGLSIDMAREELKNVGLELDELFTTEDSDQVKGTIIKSMPNVGELVTAGDVIKVVVSSGESDDNATPVAFKLPKSGTGKVTIYLNDIAVKSESNLLFQGQSYTLKLSGKGSADKMTVKVNDNLYYGCTINFTTSPAQITNITDFSGSVGNNGSDDDNSNDTTAPYIESVVDWSLSGGKDRLSSAGYKNIKVVYQKVDDVNKSGVIISQTPSGNGNYNSNTLITLTVGTYGD